MGYKAIG